MTDDSLLREPADRGVRLIALSLLADARRASDKLESATGDKKRDDALHDFRVAVRRLRSWLRAFKSWNGDAVSRKHRRRLREIADATATARDATVHLEWLHDEHRGMGVRQRIGGRWLRDRLTNCRTDGMEAALAAATDFSAMSAKLERRLGKFCRDIEQEEPPSLGAVMAARVLEASDELRGRLAAIAHDTDVDEAHRARIAAKRLRYVVEPLAALTIDGQAIVESLKSLQDTLGDLHDVHVFSAEVRSTTEDANAEALLGLTRIGRRLETRGARAYAAVTREWLADAGAPFFAAVRALVSDIERRAL
jgi:CHAD domain-containing protein